MVCGAAARAARQINCIYWFRSAYAEGQHSPEVCELCLPKRLIYKSCHGGFGRNCIPAIAETRLGTLEVCVPPLVEQTAIARFLDGKIEKIREGVARAQGEIDLLGEYRTRLIADVVTGKLDVRAAAAGLPETDPLAPADGADAPADADDALAPASPDRAA